MDQKLLVSSDGKLLISNGKLAQKDCCCTPRGACCHPSDCDPETHRYVCTIENEQHCTDSVADGGLGGTYLGNGTECLPTNHCCPCPTVHVILSASFTFTPPLAPPDCILTGGFSINGDLEAGRFGSPCAFYKRFDISGWACGGTFNPNPASYIDVTYFSSPIGDVSESSIVIEAVVSCDGGCGGFDRNFQVSSLDVPSSFSVNFTDGGNTEDYSGAISFT